MVGTVTKLGAAVLAFIAMAASPRAMADPIDDAVRAEFLATTAEVCPEGGQMAPTIHHVTFNYPGEPQDGPGRDARVYQFFCFSGPYTVMHVYYIHTAVEGIAQATFAVPDFLVHCTPPDATECRRARIEVTGVATVAELANTEFDPLTMQLRSRICWRGPCDAFADGVWVFEGGRFVLRQYDVDATYDGEQTPVRIVDFLD